MKHLTCYRSCGYMKAICSAYPSHRQELEALSQTDHRGAGGGAS